MSILRVQIVNKKMSSPCSACKKPIEIGEYRVVTSPPNGQRIGVYHRNCIQEFLDSIDFCHCGHRETKHFHFSETDTPCSEPGCDCKKFSCKALLKKG